MLSATAEIDRVSVSRWRANSGACRTSRAWSSWRRCNCGTSLAEGDVEASDGRAVLAFDRDDVAAGVEDGDRQGSQFLVDARARTAATMVRAVSRVMLTRGFLRCP
jgi:hypothetical protein